MRNILKNLIICFVTILLYCYVFIQPVSADTIKVGFPDIKGFSQIIDGKYSGYVYEYLMEISKYTGWKYEFIDVDLREMTSMLKSGKIDMAGGVLKNDKTEKVFNFPEYDSGSSYTTILVLKENTTISETNYNTLSGISIGALKNSASIERFKEFCEKNGIKDTKIIEYEGDSDEVLHEALRNKEIDAVLERDLLVSEGERVAARFSSTPYYFATTKNNSEIITLTRENIVSLLYKEFKSPYTNMSRDMWIFSFFMVGMNMVDIFHLFFLYIILLLKLNKHFYLVYSYRFQYFRTFL